MKQVFDVMLVVNPLPCCHSSKNSAASRSTLLKGIDEAGGLLVVAGLLSVSLPPYAVSGAPNAQQAGVLRDYRSLWYSSAIRRSEPMASQ